MEERSLIDKIFEECTEIQKNKLKRYTIEYKLKILKLIELNVSLHQIENKLGISRKTLREWREKKSLLNDVINKGNRYRCDRKLGIKRNFTEEEEYLIKNWIIDCRKKYAPVSTKSLVCYAGSLNEDFKAKNLKVKLRWAYRYLKRNGFSIRRISHQGQFIPREHSVIKKKFINDIINRRKEINIEYDDNSRIINMDETPCYLDMNYETTIDFTGKKNVETLTNGKEQYRISVILSITGDGYKLPPLIIMKGEKGKTIENSFKNLWYIKNKDIFIHCQSNGWCTSEIFGLWINEVFLPYQNNIGEKCLLVFDQASSHISSESIQLLKENNISFVLIPAGMTPECQPLDISINKKFKENITHKFELNRLFFENLNPKIKLQKARLNLVDFIHIVWKQDDLITKSDIISGFRHAGIIDNFYYSSEEDKIIAGYQYDLIGFQNEEILDDLGVELNINENDFENDSNSDEDDLEKLKNEIDYNKQAKDNEDINNNTTEIQIEEKEDFGIENNTKKKDLIGNHNNASFIKDKNVNTYNNINKNNKDLFENQSNIHTINTNFLFNNSINDAGSFFNNNNAENCLFGNNYNMQGQALFGNSNFGNMSNSMYKKDNLLSRDLEDLDYIFNEENNKTMRQKLNDFDKMDIEDNN